MSQIERSIQPVLVYLGSLLTMTLAWFADGLLVDLKNGVAILVGIATLIYTLLKIVQIRKDLKQPKKLDP